MNAPYGLASHGTLNADTLWHNMVEDLAASVEVANNFLRKFGLGQYEIDEVALLCADARSVRALLDSAVLQPNIEHFNAAFDEVKTIPIPSQYFVRYDFLRIKGETFRVEVMNLLDGISPVHAPSLDRLRRNEEGMMPFHLSFKVPSVNEYEKVWAALVTTEGTALAQECESTYGRFSYWRNAEEIDGFFIKPRVNLRDA